MLQKLSVHIRATVREMCALFLHVQNVAHFNARSVQTKILMCAGAHFAHGFYTLHRISCHVIL
jgi:hypothetical protein